VLRRVFQRIIGRDRPATRSAVPLSRYAVRGLHHCASSGIAVTAHAPLRWEESWSTDAHLRISMRLAELLQLGTLSAPCFRMTEIGNIKPHMPVVCSEGGQFAVVDHMASDNRTIKLQKDGSGSHHYIPVSWVTKIDNAVHIDRPGDQAMREWSSEAA
jgi:hypothetical protein